MSNVLEHMAVAVQAAPDDAPLRVQYARLLLLHERPAEALENASTALRLDPTNGAALALVTEAATALTTQAPATAEATTPPASSPAPPSSPHQDPTPSADDAVPAEEAPSSDAPGFDWERVEAEMGIDVPRPFVEDAAPAEPRDEPFLVPARDDAPSADGLLEVSRETITLDDVGGLESVKKRIREAFLEPMRNQSIARAFGKSLRGGLLLYGPPGTGKTFMARAVAGELGARFLTVTLADILDKYIGESEQNLHNLFQRARELAPAVLFLDEVDAIGGKRTQYTGSSGMRTVVNQLLQEMDGMGSDNDGLFVLGATNHPWDVDSALLRPGRFDRMVLVLPPDAPARESILRHYLEGRPIAGISLSTIVDQTDGFSGADLEHLCASAAEKAMMDSIASGEIRPITMDDVRAALSEVRPSTTAWLHSARNVVSFANNDGRYDELGAYLRSRRML
ncbi:ATP-binding protein [Oerskovia flava]|uniref:ATP-binding protein n=1 Tax=Oerskovia flava TaxID=2986422 RepID=UPI00223FB55F|nr:ATP-binding protein [Oerskovia sp. JB1-3-2]